MPRRKKSPPPEPVERTPEELEREIGRLERRIAEQELEIRVLRGEIARYCLGVMPRKPKLMSALEGIVGEWRVSFGQERVFERAREVALGFLLNLGRNTVTGSITAMGRAQEDWSATYRLFSEARVDPVALFRPLLRGSVERSTMPFVVLALDDSQLKKTGRKIPGCRWLRAPLSPPFHANLQWAQRFVQASVVVPNGEAIGPARGVPVAFRLAPSAKKPGKRGTEEEWAAYRVARREQSLGRQAAALVEAERAEVDSLPGGAERRLLVCVDGSMANRSFLRALPERTDFLGRVRGDSALYAPYSGPDRRRKYGEKLSTPEEVRCDDSAWLTVEAYGAGKVHQFRVKERSPVLWRTPTGPRPLRLIVIAPLGYRLHVGGDTLYRHPAYLLTSELTTPLNLLLQSYVHRWEIEVNFRDEKTGLGVGEAQVWHEESVERAPALLVAAYGALLLAAREAYGSDRTEDYLPPPAWRRVPSRRPSLADMRSRLRSDAWHTWIPTTSHPMPRTHEARGSPPPLAQLALTARR
jgi:hypothetical protein